MLTYPLPCVCPSHSGHSSAWSRVSCAIQHVLISCTCFIHLLFVVQLLSRVWLSATPWTEAHQASLSFTVSRSLFKPTSIESVMPSNLLILCRPLLLLPSVLPSIRVSSSESAFHIRWPKYWSFSITPSNGVRSTLKKEKKSFSVFSGWEYSPSREPYELGRFGCNSLTCTDQHLFSVFWLELKPRPPGLCSQVVLILLVGCVRVSFLLWQWLGNADGVPCPGPGRLVPCVPATCRFLPKRCPLLTPTGSHPL